MHCLPLNKSYFHIQKRISSTTLTKKGILTKEFPEDIIWVTEGERPMEVASWKNDTRGWYDSRVLSKRRKKSKSKSGPLSFHNRHAQMSPQFPTVNQGSLTSSSSSSSVFKGLDCSRTSTWSPTQPTKYCLNYLLNIAHILIALLNTVKL